MSSSWEHVFVIYRIDYDFFEDACNVNKGITVKEVLKDENQADLEIKRLNKNARENTKYYCQVAKFYSEGRIVCE